MSAPARPAAIDHWQAGEQHLAAVLESLHGRDLEAPSLLPGWSRRTVLAHLARNADAVGNLLVWARTGEPTPMYPSPVAREEGITRTAALPPDALLEDCRSAAQRFITAVGDMPEPAWQAEVVTAQGRTVPASEVLWMRAREVWVHGLDLDAGRGFRDLPEAVLVALVDDVHRTWERRQQDPGTSVTSGARTWGDGPVEVSGPLADVAAWVTGRGAPEGLRSAGALPTLPSWI